MKAVSEGRPQIQDSLTTSQAIDSRLHLYVTAGGNPIVIRDSADHRLCFVLPLADHRRRVEELSLPPTSEIAGFVLRGVPSIPLLARLHNIKHANGYEPPIDIIETDPEVFAIWLRIVKDDRCLGGPRVGLFVGPDGVNEYRRHLESCLTRAAGGIIITNTRPGWPLPPLDADFFKELEQVRAGHKRRLIERQVGLYGPRDCAYWAARFGGTYKDESPLRVLVFTTRFSTVIQHAMRDLAGALRRRGCAVDLVKEVDSSCQDVDTWASLAEAPYDLVVVTNHLRSEFGDRIHPHLPYVCWSQDHMEAMWKKEAGRSVGQYDLVLTPSPWFLESFCDYPPDGDKQSDGSAHV